MEKKEIEQKKQESKIKQESRQQEYTVEEYVKVAESLFSTMERIQQATIPSVAPAMDTPPTFSYL